MHSRSNHKTPTLPVSYPTIILRNSLISFLGSLSSSLSLSFKKYKTKMILYIRFVALFILLVSSTSASCFSSSTLLKDHRETFDLPTFSLPSKAGAGRRLSSSPVTVNVDDFGAKGDGTDDSEAFNSAWKVACSSKKAVLLVPKNRIYHLKPVTFSGPCNSGLTMRIDGTIKASNKPSDYSSDPTHWLVFKKLLNFNVQGAGTFNGNGKIWWRKSCKHNKSLPCKDAPTAVTFTSCTNLGVSGIRSKNAQQMHITFQKCENVKAWNLKVYAPESSPNTDGIHVTGSKNVQIMSSLIRTGDDCVSIVNGSSNVKVTDIKCGPGHGISIGSLGKANSEAIVSDVLVNRAQLSGTSNGVRIKTWPGGSGYAKNIVFQNIVMNNVTNPIIITQKYCDQKTPCVKQDSDVQIENVSFNNIKGTSASDIAITLDCSDNYPCKGIVLQNINLVSKAGRVNEQAKCYNVDGLSSLGRVSPDCSLEEN